MMLAAISLLFAAASEPAAKRTIDWVALPILSYDSDDKIGYGAAGQIQWTGSEPYLLQIAAQILFTTNGVQSHWVRLDSPHFFGTMLRVWMDAEYHHEGSEPWYGVGNATSDAPADHPELSAERPFVYERSYPLLRLGASYPLLVQGLRAAAFVRYLRMSVKAAPGSLLDAQQPLGIEGGTEVEGAAGLYFDRRDHEQLPTKGYLLELSARGAGGAFGSRYSYGGLNARALGFVPLGSRVVLAGRIEGDALSAGAPFFELPQFGGTDTLEGLGGQSSLRGIPKDRYVGRVKALATAEARYHFADAKVFKQALSFGAVAFLDLGRVWALKGDDGPLFKVHPGYGGGLRAWKDQFVVRIDVASSADRALNFYVLFGQFF